MADSLKTRILVNLVGKPAVIIPALGSLIAFAGATVAQNPGMPVFAGILGLLATAGVVGYRFVFKMDEVREGVKEELKGERTQSRDATLDDLYRRLLGDNDPRTEEQLDALRKLDDEFGPDQPAMRALNAFSSVKIREGVDELFNRSILLLEKSLQVYHSARGLPREAADELRRVRLGMLDEVDRNIESLGKTLAGLHRLSVAQLETEEHSELRQQLEDNLDTALQADALSRGGKVHSLHRERN